jgi:aspartate racemase
VSGAARKARAEAASGPAAARTAPLSLAQERLWFLQRLYPDNPAYNLPAAFRIRGSLDARALSAALTEIARRHSVLRTRFVSRGGPPMQEVRPEPELSFHEVDLAGDGGTSASREARAEAIAREEGRRPFDLAADAPLRATLVRLSAEADDHLLVLVMPHIVADAWSVEILAREIDAVYAALAAGEIPSLPKLPVEYADFALWQRQWLQGRVLEKQLAYWKRELADAPPPLELPSDRVRPPVASFQGATLVRELPERTAAALESVARAEGGSLFMALHAAFSAFLHRITGETEVRVGSAIANRSRSELEGLVGFFVNTLVLRSEVSGSRTFRELLRRSRETALAAYAHQDLPFAHLVRELAPERDLAHNPLFQVLLVVQAPLELEPRSALSWTPAPIDYGAAKFDLALFFERRRDGLRATVEYATDLFERSTVEGLLGAFETLLAAAAERPDVPVGDLPLLSAAAEARVLAAANGPALDLPALSCSALFERRARSSPGAPAVTGDGEALDYAELDRRATRLARLLKSRGVGPGSRVGVCLERSARVPVALLAVWKAGAAYVPLDPSYPPERLALLARSAGVRLVVTGGAEEGRLPEGTADIVSFDRNRRALSSNRESAEPFDSGAGPDDLAYVLYTSGSTGSPKGVEVPHRAVARLAFGIPGVRLEGAAVLHAAPLAFDASTFEIWGPLLNGGRCVVLPAGPFDARPLKAVLDRHRVDTVWLTSTLFNALVDERPEALGGVRQLVVGGEALSVPHVRRALEALPDTRIFNGYGPTECTTFALVHPIPRDLPEDTRSIPIGRPIACTSAYVLDRSRRPVPPGIPGELYLGGDGLARGYLGDPERTAERFVPSPFAADPAARLYATGDRVRMLEDGSFDFVGRIDEQLKIRGFRIEPGEVEAALTSVPGVAEAAVTARVSESGDRRLVGWVVPADVEREDVAREPAGGRAGGHGGTVARIREDLARRLPDHMIPSQFVLVERLPRTKSGKLDRSALPDDAHADAGHGYVAPRDVLELTLANLWEKLLGVRRIGVRDNFFELGGHSLLAARLFAQIESAFGKNLPLATLFSAPTVEHLAELLRQKGWRPSWSSLVPIQAGGSRPPFYCVHSAGGNVLTYRDLARRLGEDQPVYGLQARGLDGREPPHTRVQDMAAHYVREIREFQPRGPYHLGGSSFGGTVAFEMAQQLRAEGETVGLLALFDTWGPGYGRLEPGTTVLRLMLSRFAQRVDLHVGNLMLGGPREKAAYVAEKTKRVAKNVRKVMRRYWKRWHQYGTLRDPVPRALAKVEKASFQAIFDYAPKPYGERLTLFRAGKQPSGIQPDPALGWTEIAQGGLEIHEVPGYHGAIVYEPRVGVLAEKLAAALERARAAGA